MRWTLLGVCATVGCGSSAPPGSPEEPPAAAAIDAAPDSPPEAGSPGEIRCDQLAGFDGADLPGALASAPVDLGTHILAGGAELTFDELRVWGGTMFTPDKPRSTSPPAATPG